MLSFNENDVLSLNLSPKEDEMIKNIIWRVLFEGLKLKKKIPSMVAMK